LERLCLAALLAVAVVVGVVLATGHVSAVATGGGWPRYDLTGVPGIVWRFGTDMGDPGRAWDPVNHGTPVPGPAAWWTAFVVTTAAVAAPAAVVVHAGRRRRQGSSSEWASRRHV
jgi:hypothetical protein